MLSRSPSPGLVDQDVSGLQRAHSSMLTVPLVILALPTFTPSFRAHESQVFAECRGEHSILRVSPGTTILLWVDFMVLTLRSD